MATQVRLIRHGETDWNAEGRIQGQLAVPLNTRGMAQVEALARYLLPSSFDAVYTSDLIRARQTAEAITRCSGHSVITDARLREWDLGVLSGLLRLEAARAFPEAARIRRDRLVDEPIPGGESIRQRFNRVTSAVAEIAARHPGAAVIVVTHGGPLGDCYRRAVGKPLDERLTIDLFNASVNDIRIDGHRWMLESWAKIDHLSDIGSLRNWEGRS